MATKQGKREPSLEDLRRLREHDIRCADLIEVCQEAYFQALYEQLDELVIENPSARRNLFRMLVLSNLAQFNSSAIITNTQYKRHLRSSEEVWRAFVTESIAGAKAWAGEVAGLLGYRRSND